MKPIQDSRLPKAVCVAIWLMYIALAIYFAISNIWPAAIIVAVLGTIGCFAIWNDAAKMQDD